MMTLIILITIPLIAWYLTTINPQYRALGRFLKKKLPFTKGKPFTCEFCTGFWLTILTYFHFAPNYLSLLLISLANGVLTFLLYLNRNGR
jgi:hypothetical protein